TPMGPRVTAVMPLNTDSLTNLVQISTVMSGLSVDLKPAGRHAAGSASNCRERGPSGRPNSRGSLARCLITPGPAITADTYETPPAVCAAPTARVSDATVSTPFWKPTTMVSAPTSGGSSASAVSVS